MRLAERLRDRNRDDRGAVAILVALMTVSLFGVAALVADLGQARVLKNEAQAASDSSALAAGNALYLAGVPTADVAGAITAARAYAAKNYDVSDADWAACQDPDALAHTAPAGVGTSATQCISFDSAVEPSTVRVVAPVRGSKLVFASIFGATDLHVSAQANAALKLEEGADCGLCILGSGGTHDLQNGEARISGGDVAINGNVIVKNNGLVLTDPTNTISVEGTAAGPVDGYSPAPLTGQEPIDDPLSAIPLPTDFTSMTAKTNPCGSTSDRGPGIYGAITFPNGTCTLLPGLYVVTGQWSFSGLAALDATAGVMLYFTCGTTSAPTPCSAPGQAGGWLDAGGNGNVKITAPSSGPYAGLAIAYDRLNTSPLNLSGNGASTYIGTIYGYSAKLRFDGNGCSSSTKSLIVMKELEFNGSGACLKSDYDQDKNVYVPPDGLHLSR